VSILLGLTARSLPEVKKMSSWPARGAATLRPIMLSNDKVSPEPGDSVAERADLLQGTLDLLILKALMLGPLHGWGISKRLRQLSADAFEVGQGSLYPALYRLEDQGWISAHWATSPEGRRAKFYTLTREGRKQFIAERSEWRLFSGAMELVLKAV